MYLIILMIKRSFSYLFIKRYIVFELSKVRINKMP